MKFMGIFLALILFLLPCLYYNASGVVSLGHQAGRVLSMSYGSLISDVSRVVD